MEVSGPCVGTILQPGLHAAVSQMLADDLSRFTTPESIFSLLPAAGCAPHLVLSIPRREVLSLGWRMCPSPCVHPSGVPTTELGKQSPQLAFATLNSEY